MYKDYQLVYVMSRDNYLWNKDLAYIPSVDPHFIPIEKSILTRVASSDPGAGKKNIPSLDPQLFRAEWLDADTRLRGELYQSLRPDSE
jgi:hypothetical protein